MRWKSFSSAAASVQRPIRAVVARSSGFQEVFQAQCMATGQAAGTVAALSAARGVAVQKVDGREAR